MIMSFVYICESIVLSTISISIFQPVPSMFYNLFP